jgi:hypothetical protein
VSVSARALTATLTQSMEQTNTMRPYSQVRLLNVGSATVGSIVPATTRDCNEVNCSICESDVNAGTSRKPKDVRLVRPVSVDNDARFGSVVKNLQERTTLSATTKKKKK